MKIKRLQKINSGEYVCTALNSKGSDKITVDVTMRQFSPVVISPKLTSAKALKGGNLTIGCQATGLPSPRLSWILPAGVMINQKQSNGRISVDELGVLRIKKVSDVDAGQYRCLAQNNAGEDSGIMTISLIPPPKIDSIKMPTRIVTVWGNTTHIPCPLDYETESNFNGGSGNKLKREWIINGFALQSGQQFDTGEKHYPNGTLIINKTTYNSQGVLVCRLTSTAKIQTAKEKKIKD